MIKILKYPDPKLLKVSTPCDNVKEVGKIIEKLREAIAGVAWGKAVGMAAPQIGINKRVFVAEGVAYINPKITWLPGGPGTYWNEGCYSLEDNKHDYGLFRPYGVTLHWFGEDGHEREGRFSGKHAQIILHEFDHLEGRLCNGKGQKPE